MKIVLFMLCILLIKVDESYAQEFINSEKHRLLILADMGNEADEVQQMLHMLRYSNEFDLEGLIAVTGKYLNPQSDEAHRRVLHPDYLRSIVVSGQTGYGINASGKGKTSPGSELIKQIVLKDDPRPVYVVVNAGSNTLA